MVNLILHIQKWIRIVSSSTLSVFVITLLLWQSSELYADNKNPRSGPFVTMAYIAAEDGRDAILLQDDEGHATIFNCSSPNEVILTPQVAHNGEYITFVVDNGQNVRVLHLLGPISKKTGYWKAPDSVVMTVRGGAWPLYDGDQNIYLAMPDQSSSGSNMEIYVYQSESEELSRLSDNMGTSNHIWPLLSPDGDKIIFRAVPVQSQDQSAGQVPKSVIYNIENRETESHFENQPVFLEQWISSGEILFSSKLNDQKSTRVYALYNPTTRTAVEIFKGNSRQGRLSDDSRYLAFIRSEPINGANFDIFIVDLETQIETNLTHSPNQSESIIGWME